MVAGPRNNKMKSSPPAKTVAGGSGVIYSNPSNDPALKAVYDKLKKNPKALDQVYNVALNSKTSLNELHNLIQIKLVHKINGFKKENPIYRDFRDGDIRHSQADIAKARELLGYCPTHNLNDGIEAVIDWYIDNTK